MNHLLRTLLIAATCLMLSGQSGADVRDSAQERTLSLSDGAPALVLPREDWILGGERVRADRAVVYYVLSSEKRGITYSVYINSVPPTQDTAALLSSSLTNPAYKFAKDITRAEVGPFRAAHFQLELAFPKPTIQTNVQASAVVDGHWFDVHISKTGQEKVDPAVLLDLLGLVRFSAK